MFRSTNRSNPYSQLKWQLLSILKVVRGVLFKLSGRKPSYEPKVYYSIGDLPDTKDDTWNSPFWISHVLNGLRGNASKESVQLNIHESGLASAVLVASLARGTIDRPVNILDLGGGVGIYYPLIKRVTSRLGLNIKYAVVDGAENCRNGNIFFNNPDEITLFDFNNDGLKDASLFLGEIDVVNISSTLHYILDWRLVLKSVCEQRPHAICISRAPTPDLASTEAYVVQHVSTSQGYCGSLRVVLIPRDQLVSEMLRQGYVLVSEQGCAGDGNNYWEVGCSDPLYYRQTIRSFLFALRINGNNTVS